MKKIGVLLLTLVLFSSFGFVLGAPNDSITSDDKEKLDDIFDDIPINPETGKPDFSKFNGTLTKAEERIYEINFWLDSNVSWMKYIFHIKPSISWLFTFNLYFILLFFLILVLKVEGLFFFISNKTSARFFGVGLFLVFMITGLYVGLARILESWKIYIFEVLIPSSLLLGILLIVVILILMYFMFPLVGAIAKSVQTYFARKAAFKQNVEMAMGAESVNKLVEQATK
tara:strand:+ start:279 stop:962 length:684 start_codon:yes stop_codon:yes gene_type:complete